MGTCIGLGCGLRAPDFLQKHGLTLDFTVTPVAVYQYGNELYNTETSKEVKLVWEAECQARKKRVAASIIEDGDAEAEEKDSTSL